MQVKLRREGKTIAPYIVRVLIDEHARRPAQHDLFSHRSGLMQGETSGWLASGMDTRLEARRPDA